MTLNSTASRVCVSQNNEIKTGAFNTEAEKARCQITAVKLHQQLAPRYFERIFYILFLALRDDGRRYSCDVRHCVRMSLF